jgi:hypothetical protein
MRSLRFGALAFNLRDSRLFGLNPGRGGPFCLGCGLFGGQFSFGLRLRRGQALGFGACGVDALALGPGCGRSLGIKSGGGGAISFGLGLLSGQTLGFGAQGFDTPRFGLVRGGLGGRGLHCGHAVGFGLNGEPLLGLGLGGGLSGGLAHGIGFGLDAALCRGLVFGLGQTLRVSAFVCERALDGGLALRNRLPAQVKGAPREQQANSQGSQQPIQEIVHEGVVPRLR